MRISGSMEPSMCSNSAFFPLTLLQFAIITSSSSLRVWCGVLQLLGWLPTGDGVGSTDLGGLATGVDVAEGNWRSGVRAEDTLISSVVVLVLWLVALGVLWAESNVSVAAVEPNSDELRFQNWGIPHSLQIQVRDSFSTWFWYRKSGIPRQLAWNQPWQSLHCKQFWFHLAALWQMSQGNLGLRGPGFGSISPAWTMSNNVIHVVSLPGEILRGGR